MGKHYKVDCNEQQTSLLLAHAPWQYRLLCQQTHQQYGTKTSFHILKTLFNLHQKLGNIFILFTSQRNKHAVCREYFKFSSI